MGTIPLDNVHIDPERAKLHSPEAVLARGHEDGDAGGRDWVLEEVGEGIRVDAVGEWAEDEGVIASDGGGEERGVVCVEVGFVGAGVDGAGYEGYLGGHGGNG